MKADLRAAPPARVVAGAVGAEEPQDRDLQAALLGQRERDVLVVELRDGVRPAAGGRRPEHERVVLRERRLAVAVDVRGRRDHQVGVERQRGAADGVGAGDVRLERHQRAAVARDLLRGQVHDRVAAVERRAQLAAVRAVELLETELRMLEARVEVRQRPVRQVVDADDLAALREQPVAEMRPDEAGGPGDSYSVHACTSSTRHRALIVLPVRTNRAVATWRKCVRIQAASVAVEGLAERRVAVPVKGRRSVTISGTSSRLERGDRRRLGARRRPARREAARAPAAGSLRSRERVERSQLRREQDRLARARCCARSSRAPPGRRRLDRRSRRASRPGRGRSRTRRARRSASGRCPPRRGRRARRRRAAHVPRLRRQASTGGAGEEDCRERRRVDGRLRRVRSRQKKAAYVVGREDGQHRRCRRASRCSDRRPASATATRWRSRSTAATAAPAGIQPYANSSP